MSRYRKTFTEALQQVREPINEFKKMTVTFKSMDDMKKASTDLAKQGFTIDAKGMVMKVDGKGADLNKYATDLKNFYHASVRAESYTMDESADEDFYNPVTEACWTGYKQVGMKNKGGKQVPNCVPEATDKELEESLNDYLKSKLDAKQLQNLKGVWARKNARDVTPAIKDMIKKMDIPTQLAIKQADIPHISKLVEEVEELEEFNMAQLDRLAKEYEPMRNKTISIDNANKLRKIFDRIPDSMLPAIRKKKIPFLSALALSRMVQKGIPVREWMEDYEDVLNEGTGTITNFRNDREVTNMMSLAKQHGIQATLVGSGTGAKVMLKGNMKKILDMQLAAQRFGLKAEEILFVEVKEEEELPKKVAKKNEPDQIADTEVKKESDDTEKLKKELEKKDDEIAMLKTKQETDKAKTTKKDTEKLVNPETGEPLLQVGIAYKHLKDKMAKEKAAKDDAEEKEKEEKKKTVAKFKDRIKESLNLDESEASDKAKGMGLDYMKFGRYGKDGKVTHKNIGGNLTAVDKDEKPIKEPKPADKTPKNDPAVDNPEVDVKPKIDPFDAQKDLEDMVTDGMIDVEDDGQGGLNATKEYEPSQDYEAEQDVKAIKAYFKKKGIDEKDIYVDVESEEDYIQVNVEVRGKKVEEAFAVQITKKDGGKLIHGKYKTKPDAEKFIKWYKTGDMKDTKSIEVVKEDMQEAKFRLEGEVDYKNKPNPEDFEIVVNASNRNEAMKRAEMDLSRGGKKINALEFSKVVKEDLNSKDKPTVKDVVGQLKQAVKAHSKQAKDLEKAIKTEMKKDDAYAIGMAQAKKSMNDEPPLDKKTIKKGHEIADKILKKEDMDAQPQDKDVKSKDGTQPKKYYKNLSKKTKDDRANHFAKRDTTKNDNSPAPGDKDAKTKPSIHTNKYKKMYGEGKMSQISAMQDQGKSAAEIAKVLKLPLRAVKTILGEKTDHSAREMFEQIAGLKKKSEKSGMPYGILKKVYDRGMAAWRGGHRPGTTQQQWAFARVNSFITKSSGTWGGADKDLAKQVRGK